MLLSVPEFMLFSCCRVRPCVRKTERDLLPSRFFLKPTCFVRHTHVVKEVDTHFHVRSLAQSCWDGGWCWWWPFHILPCEASGRRQQKCGSGFTARGNNVEGSCSSAGMCIPPDGSSWANLYLTSARFSSFRSGKGLALRLWTLDI